jgi:hypothetical protein
MIFPSSFAPGTIAAAKGAPTSMVMQPIWGRADDFDRSRRGVGVTETPSLLRASKSLNKVEKFDRCGECVEKKVEQLVLVFLIYSQMERVIRGKLGKKCPCMLLLNSYARKLTP